jgi:co-chaperonin GroES (HSP10)
MNCPECGIEVVVGGDDREGTHYYEPVNKALALVVHDYKIPFYCTMCNALKFPMKAHNNYVVVWEPLPDVINGIIIPDDAKKGFRKGLGVILSSGSGVYNKELKRYVPNVTKPGDVVYYDRSVPWVVEAYGVDGKLYEVPIMPEQDIKAWVSE